jgi:hypothetical protein
LEKKNPLDSETPTRRLLQPRLALGSPSLLLFSAERSNHSSTITHHTFSLPPRHFLGQNFCRERIIRIAINPYSFLNLRINELEDLVKRRGPLQLGWHPLQASTYRDLPPEPTSESQRQGQGKKKKKSRWQNRIGNPPPVYL